MASSITIFNLSWLLQHTSYRFCDLIIRRLQTNKKGSGAPLQSHIGDNLLFCWLVFAAVVSEVARECGEWARALRRHKSGSCPDFYPVSIKFWSQSGQLLCNQHMLVAKKLIRRKKAKEGESCLALEETQSSLSFKVADIDIHREADIINLITKLFCTGSRQSTAPAHFSNYSWLETRRNTGIKYAILFDNFSLFGA